MENLGLTAEDGMSKAWFVDGNGRLTGGAEAVNLSVRGVWWLKPFTYLYDLPGLRQLENWIYQWIADNRHRLPGATEACAVPQPDDPDQL